MQESRGATGKAAPQQQVPNDTELDDDELLDMMGDMQPEPHADSGLPVSASMQPPLNDTLEGKVCAVTWPFISIESEQVIKSTIVALGKMPGSESNHRQQSTGSSL